MDSFKRFKEDKLHDNFEIFSSLRDKCISSLKDKYHVLNLKIGVLLLAVVFFRNKTQKFIKTYLENYKLDSCHYFSSPGLIWFAMLKVTGVELEIISDIDMHLFIEKGMKGDISYIAKGHSKIKHCNSKEKKKFIIY